MDHLPYKHPKLKEGTTESITVALGNKGTSHDPLRPRSHSGSIDAAASPPCNAALALSSRRDAAKMELAQVHQPLNRNDSGTTWMMTEHGWCRTFTPVIRLREARRYIPILVASTDIMPYTLILRRLRNINHCGLSQSTQSRLGGLGVILS